jgi:hypothetical protein
VSRIYPNVQLLSELNCPVKQLTSFYDDILTILQTNSLPTPNASRTHGLLLWILQTQQLPASILLSRKERLQRVVSDALDGAFGREQFQADGLKVCTFISLFSLILSMAGTDYRFTSP